MLMTWLSGFQCRSAVGPPLWYRMKNLNNIGWVAMEFGTDIHAAHRMNPKDTKVSCSATSRSNFSLML